VTVREIWGFFGAFLAGALLGGIFFGGLWLTIRLTLSSAALGLWLVVSFLLRTAITLVGIYVVFDGNWQRLIACLLGFTLARFMIAWVTKPAISTARGGVRHAP